MWLPLKPSQRKGRCFCTILTVVLGMLSPASAPAQVRRNSEEAAAVALATRALADDLKTTADAFVVRRVSPIEWRDSSLGCAERGKVYSQQIVAGYQVELAHQGRAYRLNVGAGRAVRCDDADPGARISAGAVFTPARRAADAVRDAVAGRAGVAAADVRIDRSRPFRGGSPPCAAAPSQPRGPAFIVDARAGGVAFTYYADDEVTVRCDVP
jgi:hypothetical protein